MSWRELETAAPVLAREGRARLERTRVALLATVRADGSPRISPVEPYFLGGDLVIGLMPSPKLTDLRRDARCALHSSVSDLSGKEGEFKIHGRAVPVTDPEILAADGTWWASRPRDRFEVLAVVIVEAFLVRWNAAQDRMETTRWSLGSDPRTTTRRYP